MSYKDIIRKNVSIVGNIIPKYAFHMIGLENAISVLSSGMLYSRNKAKEIGTMSVDNASKGVIDNTDSRVMDYARFYFRPKTPTYYYFEGYHQEGLRYQNDNGVDIPVPVLFVFNLEKLLSDDNTVFNGIKASGNNYNPQKGLVQFSQLEFAKIYGDAKEERDYQQAEILYPYEYSIEQSLEGIMCRNLQEMQTLLCLLKSQSINLVEKWRPMIHYCKKTHREQYFCDKGLRLIVRSIEEVDNIQQIIFSIEGQDDYYWYVTSKNVLQYTSLDDYPPLKAIFDIRFCGSEKYYSFSKVINLNIRQIVE